MKRGCSNIDIYRSQDVTFDKIAKLPNEIEERLNDDKKSEACGFSLKSHKGFSMTNNANVSRHGTVGSFCGTKSNKVNNEFIKILNDYLQNKNNYLDNFDMGNLKF